MSDLSDRILFSAQELFFKKGYYSTATREIAKEAGTSESGIFRLFKSKYEVLMAVYNESWKKVNTKIDIALEGIDDPIASILKIAEVVFSMYDEDRMAICFIVMNTGNTDTLILERKEESIISQENMLYINRLQELSNKCFEAKTEDELLTSESLCEGVMGIIEGVLLGWYLSDNSNDYPYKISKNEAVNLVKVLLRNMEV